MTDSLSWYQAPTWESRPIFPILDSFILFDSSGFIDVGRPKEQYRVEILKRFPAWENLDATSTLRAQETNRENIKISAKDSLGYYELKKHNPSLDKGF
jgi:hypothetical protein